MHSIFLEKLCIYSRFMYGIQFLNSYDDKFNVHVFCCLWSVYLIISVNFVVNNN